VAERWVTAHGEENVRWFKDTFTGKTLNRPGFNRLLADIRAGKIDTVVVWRLDRLGRTARGLTELFEEFADRKTNLVSLKDGLDLKTSAGRLMANVLASVAQFETEIRAERVLAGLAVARERGVRLGRPEGVHTRIKVTDEQAAQARRLKGEGHGVSAISRATGLSRPTVYGLIRASA
jgi:DNA invertase Pin-like site-specific DNA recombinase